MNEKFFDLKKEKQDRMINASMKAFAFAGYEHASTDDIVRDAGVSKGLLFHYFGSKLGLYEFLYDYAAKFEQLEMSSCIGRDETDFFELREQMLRAQANVMKNYPYLPLFLDRADREEDEDASKAVGAMVIAHAEQMRERMLSADSSRFKPEADMGMVAKMLNGAFRVAMTDALRLEDISGEYYRECRAFLDMMRGLCLSDEQTEAQDEETGPGSGEDTDSGLMTGGEI